MWIYWDCLLVYLSSILQVAHGVIVLHFSENPYYCAILT